MHEHRATRGLDRAAVVEEGRHRVERRVTRVEQGAVDGGDELAARVTVP